MKAARGDVELHAHRGLLQAFAQDDVKIESSAGRVEITATQELVLNCGGAYIRIKDGEIELGAPGNIAIKAAHVEKFGATTLSTPATPVPEGYSAAYTLSEAAKAAAPYVRYRITTAQGDEFTGVTDKDGKTMPAHTQLPGKVTIDYPEAERRLGFCGPVDENYEGLTCTVTMDDGSKATGLFGSDNKANVYPETGSVAVDFQMDEVAKDEQVPSVAEALLKDLMR